MACLLSIKIIKHSEETMSESKIEKLHKMRASVLLGGGKSKIDKQHSSKKMTARERLAYLLDPGTFHEIDTFRHTPGGEPGDILGEGVVTGWGLVNGRQIFVYAQDFTVVGGTLSKQQSEKICKVMDLAMKNGCPVIGICDSGGARIQGGVASLAGYGDIFLLNTLASGVIPQITLIMGPCAGGACYSPALTDFIFMVDGTSHMFITGPQVVKTVTFEEVDFETLGGANVHNTKSGVAHFMAKDEKHCLEMVKELLSYLPQNNLDDPPAITPKDDPNRMDPELNEIVPDNPNKPYNMKKVIQKVFDNGEFFEVHANYAKNIIVGYARLNGNVVGVVAQQPNVLAGSLDINASIKGARFVRFCDCFNIPIITFEDVPGFLPGVNQEHGGIIRNGAKLIYAYCEATVPKITVICRKAYGGAYIVMNSRHVRGDLVFAWPGAEIAVMGPEGAVNILFKDEIAKSDKPEELTEALIEQYRSKFANPYLAAEKGYIDEVIHPKDTRMKLIKALKMLENKSSTLSFTYKKHGNMPV